MDLCTSFYPSIHPSLHPSILPSIPPFIYPSVHPSCRPSIFPSILLLSHPFIHLSIISLILHSSILLSTHPSTNPSSTRPSIHQSINHRPIHLPNFPGTGYPKEMPASPIGPPWLLRPTPHTSPYKFRAPSPPYPPPLTPPFATFYLWPGTRSRSCREIPKIKPRSVILRLDRQRVR